MKDKLRIVWKCNKCFSSKRIEEEDENISLNSKVRSCYLHHLQKVLLNNYQNCLLEATNHDFSANDVRSCAAEMELQAIYKCVVVVLYQRAMAKMITDIKKDTRRQKIHKKLKDFVPSKSDGTTQTNTVRDLKPASVQTSRLLQEDCCLPSPSESESHKQQETDCQDVHIKQERFSPQSMQQTPPSSPALDEIPLPGSDPPESEVGLQHSETAVQVQQPETAKCPDSLCAIGPTQTQSFKILTPNPAVSSTPDRNSQPETSSSASSLDTVQTKLGSSSNQHISSVQPLLSSSQIQQQIHPASAQSSLQQASQQPGPSLSTQSQLQHASQQLVSSSGQSQIQKIDQKLVSSLNTQFHLQQATQQPVSYLIGQSKLAQETVSSLSGQSKLQHVEQKPVPSLNTQSHFQHANQQPVSCVSGHSQSQHPSELQVPSLSGHPKLKHTSQEPVSGLNEQSHLQYSNQPVPSLSTLSVVQHASQQQVLSVSGQLQMQHAVQNSVSSLSVQSQLQHANQLPVSSLNAQSHVQNSSQLQVSSLSTQSQLQHETQQPVSSSGGQSQLQHSSQQAGSFLTAQSKLELTSQDPVSSLSIQSQLQHASQQLVPSLSGHSQMQYANQQPVPTLNTQSQFQLADHKPVSVFNEQSQLQHANQQPVPSLSTQSQLQHTSQQLVSSSSGLSQLQHACQQPVSSLSLPLHSEHASQKKNSSLSGMSQLQLASKQQLSPVSGHYHVQHVIQQKLESLSSHPQKPQCQVSLKKRHVSSQPESKNVIQQPVKPGSKIQLSSASEKELQALALQHLQAAYEKWLLTANKEQRLIIEQQQAQSSGQVLQSASQQRLQAACLRRLRSAYQAWSRECTTDNLHRLQAAYVLWLNAATSRQAKPVDETDVSAETGLSGSGGLQVWPPSSLSRLSRPRQPVQPCVRQPQDASPVKVSSLLDSQQIQVVDHQESNTASWQFPSSDPCDTVVPNAASSDAGLVLQKTNLIRRYRQQQGSGGVVEVSPIPVVLSRNTGLLHKVQFQQQPSNPNNIEIIPVSEDALVKIEAEEIAGREIAVISSHAESKKLIVSPCRNEGTSFVTPLNKRNNDDDKENKEKSDKDVSKTDSVATQNEVDSDDALEPGPSPTFSSTDSETSSKASSSKSSVNGEKNVGGETEKIGSEISREESVQPDHICTEVKEDFQTKLLLRELLSGSNTPTDELIEGTEIPYDAIVSGLEELGSQNAKKRKSETDVQLPEKRTNMSVVSADVESAKSKVDSNTSDSPEKGFWARELLAQQIALAHVWQKLSCNVLKKARRKQRCVRLFGSDEDLVLTERELNICKGRIIPWIVRELKPYYREGRVISRPVFKSVARHTANRLVSRNCYPECSSKNKPCKFVILLKIILQWRPTIGKFTDES
ncbi:uncharacterized protein LOC134542343 isoform X2 [Bacillus rossius redtenbacheri]|uniref:uncharacterized protein LOC134542343 isoform X2 n=1 Tax=Bacillus rossius redtenbacheri TaxID=93214 RepID=UPI002FDE4BEB